MLRTTYKSKISRLYILTWTTCQENLTGNVRSTLFFLCVTSNTNSRKLKTRIERFALHVFTQFLKGWCGAALVSSAVKHECIFRRWESAKTFVALTPELDCSKWAENNVQTNFEDIFQYYMFLSAKRYWYVRLSPQTNRQFVFFIIKFPELL